MSNNKIETFNDRFTNIYDEAQVNFQGVTLTLEAFNGINDEMKKSIGNEVCSRRQWKKAEFIRYEFMEHNAGVRLYYKKVDEK